MRLDTQLRLQQALEANHALRSGLQTRDATIVNLNATIDGLRCELRDRVARIERLNRQIERLSEQLNVQEAAFASSQQVMAVETERAKRRVDELLAEANTLVERRRAAERRASAAETEGYLKATAVALRAVDAAFDAATETPVAGDDAAVETLAAGFIADTIKSFAAERAFEVEVEEVGPERLAINVRFGEECA